MSDWSTEQFPSTQQARGSRTIHLISSSSPRLNRNLHVANVGGVTYAPGTRPRGALYRMIAASAAPLSGIWDENDSLSQPARD